MKRRWQYVIELWCAFRGRMYQPAPRPCPPEITSDIGRQLWDLIEAVPFDREAYDRAIGEWSAQNFGADKAASSGAAHELEFYGGQR